MITERPSPGEESKTSRCAPPAGHGGTEALLIREESAVSTSGPFSPKGQPGAPWGRPWEVLLLLSTEPAAESQERNISTLTALFSQPTGGRAQ